jgi:hypothetical protein
MTALSRGRPTKSPYWKSMSVYTTSSVTISSRTSRLQSFQTSRKKRSTVRCSLDLASVVQSFKEEYSCMGSMLPMLPLLLAGGR